MCPYRAAPVLLPLVWAGWGGGMHAGDHSILCSGEAQVSGRSACSRTQNASAIPPSWLRESRACSPRCSTHSAVRPVKRYAGAPEGSRTASISQREKGSRNPVPAALRKASLAAKSAAALAARCAQPRAGSSPVSGRPRASRSAGPKTRRANAAPWGPVRLYSIRSTPHRSQPIP